MWNKNCLSRWNLVWLLRSFDLIYSTFVMFSTPLVPEKKKKILPIYNFMVSATFHVFQANQIFLLKWIFGQDGSNGVLCVWCGIIFRGFGLIFVTMGCVSLLLDCSYCYNHFYLFFPGSIGLLSYSSTK